MNKLLVEAKSREYPIYFEDSFDELIKNVHSIEKDYSSYIIITDTNVQKLYSEKVFEQIASLNKKTTIISFQAGEINKNFKTIENIYSKMIEVGTDRKSLVIALGGGVVGDMAGFVASTYMRGIDFIQIPTTLLSQVDSSVGGKTGYDFNGLKNIIGVFYQPQLVYINVNTLKTLDSRQFSSGMAEIIKHGIIKDEKYLIYLNENANKIMKQDKNVLMNIIKRSCEIKASVVEEDEKETGTRALLNFGHTFGHSIETIKEFKLFHGECVAIGMNAELLISYKLGLITKKELDYAIETIKMFELPVKAGNISVENVYKTMFKDKKTTNNKIVVALITKLGKSKLSKNELTKELILDCIEGIL